MRWILLTTSLLSAPRADPAGTVPLPHTDPLPRRVAVSLHLDARYPDAGFFNSDGSDRLAQHYPDPAGVDSTRSEWLVQELTAMQSAGIDFVLPALGTPASDRFTGAVLEALADALREVAEAGGVPLAAGLYLDTVSAALQRDDKRLDLARAGDFEALYGVLRDYFERVPREHWARLEGRPLVVVSDRRLVKNAPEDLFAVLAQRFREDFSDREPFFVLDSSWKQHTAPPHIEWLAPLLGAQPGPVTCIGPGFDDTRVTGRKTPMRLREGGRFYERSWQRVLAHPDSRLVVVNSWNQHENGTGIGVTLETGRRYVELTRQWADRFRGREPPGPEITHRKIIAPSASYHDRKHVGAARVTLQAWVEHGGIAPRVLPEYPIGAVRTAAGEPALQLSSQGAHTRFGLAVADPFSFCEPLRAALSLELRTAGPGRVHIEYRSALDRDGAPRLTEPVAVPAGPSPSITFLLEDLRLANDLRESSDLVFHFEGEGAVDLLRAELTRRSGRLPRVRLGVTDPELLARGADAEWIAGRVQRAAQVGARWLRFPVDWAALEPAPGKRDYAALDLALAALARSAIQPLPAISGAPAFARPLPAHAEDFAAWAAELVHRYRRTVRHLEVIPLHNRPGWFQGAPHPQLYARVLRAVERSVHAVDPSLTLALGALYGSDTEYLRALLSMRETTLFDAVVLQLAPECGLPGSPTLEESMHGFTEVLRSHGDHDKPLWIVAASDTSVPPLSRTAHRGLLADLVGASRQLAGLPAGRVAVSVDSELPIVRGTRPALVLELLSESSMDAEPWGRERGGAPDPAEFPTFVLPHGEVVAGHLLPSLIEYVDAGGLLVLLGGAPLRRTATWLPGAGAYRLDESRSAAVAIQDDLRLAFSQPPHLRDRTRLPLWRRASVLGALLPEDPAALPTPALMHRRAGRPRDLVRGHHRYRPLLHVEDGGDSPGDAAALLQFLGGRKGAVLALTLDAGGAVVDESEQARQLGTLAKLLETGADLLLWGRLLDGPEPPHSGLLRADQEEKAAAQVFRALVQAEAER